MTDTVTILKRTNVKGDTIYQAHCNRCLKDLLGKHGSDTAVTKTTVVKWAQDHLSKHEFRATWPERMVSYGYEIAGTIELEA
jgi:hypothetical protein